jgi:hypothetical protein
MSRCPYFTSVDASSDDESRREGLLSRSSHIKLKTFSTGSNSGLRSKKQQDNPNYYRIAGRRETSCRGTETCEIDSLETQDSRSASSLSLHRWCGCDHHSEVIGTAQCFVGSNAPLLRGSESSGLIHYRTLKVIYTEKIHCTISVNRFDL